MNDYAKCNSLNAKSDIAACMGTMRNDQDGRIGARTAAWNVFKCLASNGLAIRGRRTVDNDSIEGQPTGGPHRAQPGRWLHRSRTKLLDICRFTTYGPWTDAGIPVKANVHVGQGDQWNTSLIQSVKY
jgi:hypothetical protein